MATDCGKLTKSIIGYECNKVAASGTCQTAWLANFDTITFNRGVATKKNVITSFQIASGEGFFRAKCADNSFTGEATLNKGTYVNTYNHSVTLRFLVKTQAVKDWITELQSSRVIVFLENHEVGKSELEAETLFTKFEVYGATSGMVITELTWTTEFSDAVVYTVKMSSDDTSKESGLPDTYISGTTVEATKKTLEDSVTIANI